MATPFGGHSAATAGEEHGLIVLPSWRDLNPENPFIDNLYRAALTRGTLVPFHPEEIRFIAVVNGEKSPRGDAEKGWLRFLVEHPEFLDE